MADENSSSSWGCSNVLYASGCLLGIGAIFFGLFFGSWLIFTLGFAASLTGSLGLAAYVVMSCIVRIDNGCVAYHVVRGRPVERALHAGLNLVGWGGTTPQYSTSPETDEVVQHVTLPDGGEINITIRLTTQVNSEQPWLLHPLSASDQALKGFFTVEIQKAVNEYCSRPDVGPQSWSEAFERQHDIAMHVSSTVPFAPYGIILLNLAAFVTKAGPMEAEDLRPGKKKRAASSVAQLMQERDRHLLEAGDDEELKQEIRESYERRRRELT